ncbi:MAG: restriction endonuclease subunit S [Bacteroidetes bacterium]|nr:restriction endonuclease subunit S [Bacteroidota bacterium]
MSWEKVSLKGIVVNLDNRRKPLNQSERNVISKQQLYPYIGANNIMGYVDEYLFDEEIICVAEDGGSWGENEKCAVYVNEKCWVNNHAHVLGFNGKADLKFIMYFLNKDNLNKYITGSTRGKLTKSALDSIQIPLPPLPEQKRIAKILDVADELKRKDNKLLKKYDELAQSIFIDMFGDPVKNKKGWGVKNLDDACIKITDGTHFSPPNQSEGIPYITAKHVKKDFIDFYSKPSYIAQQYHDEIFSRCTPKRGDVLYIKDGATTGIAAVNEFDFEFSMLSSLALLKPNKELLNSYYLSFYLNDEIVKQNLIREYMAGAAIKRFTLDKIKKFKIIMPPIKLQNEFEKRWKTLRLNVEILKKFESKELFNSLIQKAFKGELV